MKKKALLISCGTYTDSNLHPLPSSIPDSARFADLLERPNLGGFDVRIVNDGTLVTVQREIHELLHLAATDDLILIYLSSHGLKDMFGRFYLALPDTDLSALPATSLSGRYIREQINDTQARRLVIILDSCFSGAFGRELMAKSISLSEGTPDEFTDEFLEGTGHAILAASSPIQYALEDGSNNSPTSVFTRAICDGIATGAADVDADGWISLSDLFEYSSKEVSARYPLQTPQMSCFGIDRDLKLMRAPSQPTTYADFDADIEEASKSIHPELRIAAATALGKITHSQNRERAASALRKLRKLRNDFHPEVREAIELHISVAPKRPRRRLPIQTPENKQVHSSAWVEVSAQGLSKASQVVPYFIDTSDVHPILSNVHFQSGDQYLRMWASDRYRVDLWRLPIESKGEKFDISILGSDVYSLKAFSGTGKVRMEVGEVFSEFECREKMLAMNSTKPKELPAYLSLIPIDSSGVAHIARAPFLDAVEKAATATKTRNTPVVLNLGKSSAGRVEISFSGDDAVSESVPMELIGDPIRIAFTPRFLIAALGSFSTKTVKMAVTHPNKPAIFTADDEPEHMHLLMPVRLDRGTEIHGESGPA
ncbi:caspase family protein [Streptomyces sp. NBC_01239]|uniref:caspase family protein n=1 Tax=Streptomyces sp. NBC_01239 TaxID=2903792 RepID=UPI0022542B5A|nr:caspase family protein [Streptomyces sp. NBC_01239]MCX4813851.1 caspase family protein [Streptomyces sp. NBC_01239]